jgi:hypothetical protein
MVAYNAEKNSQTTFTVSGESVRREILLGAARSLPSDTIHSKDPEDPALNSPQLPAPLPARRASRPEGRAYSSERGVEFTLDSKWHAGMKDTVSNLLVGEASVRQRYRLPSNRL